jgi:HK97 family phage major capsid protein
MPDISARPEPRLAERSAENPTGVLYRDFVVRIEPRDDAADGDTRLQIAISSEQPVVRYDWTTGERYIEVLDHTAKGPDLSYARDGLPFCLDHSLGRQIGLLEQVRVDADGMIRGELLEGNHPDAAWVIADMRTGVRKKVSVGYDPGSTYTQTAPRQKGGMPTRRYTGWRLYEASSVAVPADYSVGVGRELSTEAASAARTEEHRMPDMISDTATERDTARAAEAERCQRLAALQAQNADIPELAGRLAGWITNNTTVDAARDEVMAALRTRNAVTPPVQPSGVRTHDRAEDKPWQPGEFFRAVVLATRNPEGADVRLLAQRAQNTGVGADGGWAVPETVATNLLEAARTGSELLSRVTERPVTVGNGYKETVVKEESRANGSRNGGVQHYWVGEDGEIPESQAKTRQVELGLKKIAVVVKLTEEQIEDGPAMQSFLDEQAPEELRFGVERAIWEGTGAGQPLGFMNSGALVSVAIESGQTIANTNTHIWMNAAKMFARMPAGMLNRAVWGINQQLWAKILTATAGAAGAHPMFTPPGQLASLPNGAIYGRPIVPVEYASAEGTVGDFTFIALPDYLLATKGGTRRAVSMHVEFLRDRQVMRFIQRVDGSPRTRVPLTPFKGGDTLSPYIALAARS